MGLLFANGFEGPLVIKTPKVMGSITTIHQFLIKPQAYAPGTAMSFPGYAKANQRADVIAYLNSLSDNPKPLPKAAATLTGPIMEVLAGNFP